MTIGTDEQFVKAARAIHQIDGEVEIDDGAVVSRNDSKHDGGAYVQAWVWVDNDQLEDTP